MRVALSKSSLLIPPSYFAVTHAQAMRADFDFTFFTMAAQVTDPGVEVTIKDFAPFRRKPFSAREKFLPAVMPAMARSIQAFDPDIIHQHFATWSWPAVRAARKGNTPLITTLHGADVVVAGKRATTAMQRWHHYNIDQVKAHSGRILAVSRYLADTAVAHDFPAEKIEIHYQGVNTEDFTPNPAMQDADHRGGRRPVILFAGALNEQKGIRHLLRSSEKLQATVDHDLVIIGKGPLREELESRTANDPHVRFMGQLGRGELMDQLRSATVVAVPSREYAGAREAAGLILLEAQACGTPVVAYASGGTPEMVGPDSGLLVAEDDVAALQEALSSVLTLGSADYQAIRHAARKFTVDERSLTKSAAELAGHYRDLATL